jgi:ParB-like chromosome segregation protein Spo0J
MGEQAFPGAKRLNGFWLPAEQIVLVGLDTKHKSKAEHFLFDARVHLPVDPAKVENVRKHGVIKPIVIRKIDGKAYAVAGRQRVKWAREASRLNKAEKRPAVLVPCYERKGSESQLWGASRSENAVVERPNPMVLAEEICDLLNSGMDEAEIAVDYGWTVQQVKDHARLVDLAKPVRDLVAAEGIRVTHAKQFLGLSHEEQEAKLAEIVEGGGKITVERVRAATRSGRNGSGSKNGHGKAETASMTLKQIHSLFAIASEHLGPREVKVIGVLCGKNKPREIAGMTEALRELGFDLDD